MSQRTLVELNHDYPPWREREAEWLQKMLDYMGSGDPKRLPQGVRHIAMYHHSDPQCDLVDRNQALQAENAQLREQVEQLCGDVKACQLDYSNEHKANKTLRSLVRRLADKMAQGTAHYCSGKPCQFCDSWVALITEARAATSKAMQHQEPKEGG